MEFSYTIINVKRRSGAGMGGVVGLPVRLYVYEMGQDDPKKCTSAKLRRLRLATSIRSLTRIPRGAVVLNPTSATVYSPADRELALRGGLVAIDCSWARAEEVFPGVNRRLPVLLAGNPVNYGQRSKLSSLEALAAALYIIGFKSEAERLLSIYKWGSTFLSLNQEPLEEYSHARSLEELSAAEASFF